MSNGNRWELLGDETGNRSRETAMTQPPRGYLLISLQIFIRRGSPDWMPACAGMTAEAGACLSSPGDQDRPKIVDVGQRRPGHHLIAERLEKAVPVVVGKTLLCIDPERLGALQRVWRNDRASDLLGAVDAVGVAGDGPDALKTIEMHRERQEEFDVAAAAPLPSHGDRCFAARYHRAGRGRWLVAHDDLPGDPAHHPADFGGFALDRVAEDQGSIARLAGDARGGLKRGLWRGDDAICRSREGRVARLWRLRGLVLETLLHR